MRWSARLGGWLLAVSLALAPLAAAETVSGGIATRSLRLDSPSEGALQPVAFFAPDASGLSLVEIRAPLLHVERHETRMQKVPTPVLPGYHVVSRGEATYDVRDARATATGAPGWLGAALAGGKLDVRAIAPTSFEPAGDEIIGHQDVGGGEAQFASFQAPVSGPHIRASLAGTATYHGPLRIMVLGPDVLVASDENETREPTGVDESTTPLGERVERWIVLTADEADLTFSTSMPIDLAATQAQVSWMGEAETLPADGSLDGASSRYVATSGVQKLEGDLRATIVPRDARLMDMGIEGDLSSTSLARVPITREVEMALPAEAVWIALGIAVAVGGGGLAINAWSRRRPPVSFGVEQAVELADLAIAEGRFEEALTWLRHARTLAPSSRRLLLDEAYCLGALGKQAEALAMYDSAGADPDAQFRAGLLLARDPGRMDESEGRLVRALSLQPALAVDVPADLEREMRGRPGFERALAEARRAMGDGEPPAQP